jgi:hypothetical protein
MILAGLIGMTALAALLTFASYRRQVRQRSLVVHQWVKDYLANRFRGLENLRIDCSDDTLWPVLVSFDGPGAGASHRMRFVCSGAPSTYALLSDQEERR